MKVYLGSIILIVLILVVLWYMLSPTFSKIGGFVGKKAKNFKKNWRDDK